MLRHIVRSILNNETSGALFDLIQIGIHHFLNTISSIFGRRKVLVAVWLGSHSKSKEVVDAGTIPVFIWSRYFDCFQSFKPAA